MVIPESLRSILELTKAAIYCFFVRFVLMQIVETRTAKIFLDENNILHLMICRHATLDYEDALDNYLIVKNLTKGKPCFKLIDIRYQVKIEQRAKLFLDTKDVQSKTLARAILINSTVKRKTFNFFIKFNLQKTLTKFFTKEEEAKEWLRSLIS
jgi:hypothetical protein